TEWTLPFPKDQTIATLWAFLGEAFQLRQSGVTTENLERSVAASSKALAFYRPAAFPKQSKQIQAQLTRAQGLLLVEWLGRLREVRTPEQAIGAARKVLDLDGQLAEWPLPIPRESLIGDAWAMLGDGLRELKTGVHTENLRQAVDAYNHALALIDRSASPTDWASARQGLEAARRELAAPAR